MKRKKRPEFSNVTKRIIIERSGNKCERCGIDFNDSFKGVFHHIIPACFGGDNHIDNCSLLCDDCHKKAPNIKNIDEKIIYTDYFLRFSSIKEAMNYYKVDNRFDLYVTAALDLKNKHLERLKKDSEKY
ncbi:MAG: HNH endonuclease [Thermoplasmatales archaeon]|nr:MAG: HNH endonuclease [Thermoplasmatales archaeon]